MSGTLKKTFKTKLSRFPGDMPKHGILAVREASFNYKRSDTEYLYCRYRSIT